jgi:hypothetical protein
MSGGRSKSYIAGEEEDGFDSTTVSDFRCDGIGVNSNSFLQFRFQC